MECIDDIRIVFIGAGNLATHTAKAIHKAGFNIVQVFSRTEVSARCLAQQLDCAYTNDPQALDQGADLYIMAVSDKILGTLAENLPFGNGLVVHTAGSIPMSIFKDKVKRYGVFYPFQTFSKERELDFSEIPIFIEGATPEIEAFLETLARRIATSVSRITSTQRKQLHLAAVFACNFVNHLYVIADDLLQSSGLTFDALKPLIQETARKVQELKPVSAQTGPAIRNDENVMREQLDQLEVPLHKELYRIISESIYRAAQAENKIKQENI